MQNQPQFLLKKIIDLLIGEMLQVVYYLNFWKPFDSVSQHSCFFFPDKIEKCELATM